jgi:hypothetical protein
LEESFDLKGVFIVSPNDLRLRGLSVFFGVSLEPLEDSFDLKGDFIVSPNDLRLRGLSVFFGVSLEPLEDSFDSVDWSQSALAGFLEDMTPSAFNLLRLWRFSGFLGVAARLSDSALDECLEWPDVDTVSTVNSSSLISLPFEKPKTSSSSLSSQILKSRRELPKTSST